ncbi:hypothetical protein KAU33_03770 [Candidatus Dependentiae bacterium]|nr:hypothetical protein [Candidatus Dependentiae bacterium]
MEEKDKWKLLSIVMTFFFISSVVIILDLNSNINKYSYETDLITNEFASLGLETPQWNESTRFFEVWDGDTAYVGYTRFNDMETNLLEIVRFDYCEMVKLGGKFQYVTVGDNTTVMVSREVQRRFY